MRYVVASLVVLSLGLSGGAGDPDKPFSREAKSDVPANDFGGAAADSVRQLTVVGIAADPAEEPVAAGGDISVPLQPFEELPHERDRGVAMNPSSPVDKAEDVDVLKTRAALQRAAEATQELGAAAKDLQQARAVLTASKISENVKGIQGTLGEMFRALATRDRTLTLESKKLENELLELERKTAEIAKQKTEISRRLHEIRDAQSE